MYKEVLSTSRNINEHGQKLLSQLPYEARSDFNQLEKWARSKQIGASVGIIIMTPDGNKTLCVRRTDTFGKYANPAGHVEIGETFLGALNRELREETGLTLGFIRDLHLGDVFCQPRRSPEKPSVYLVFWGTMADCLRLYPQGIDPKILWVSFKNTTDLVEKFGPDSKIKLPTIPDLVMLREINGDFGLPLSKRLEIVRSTIGKCLWEEHIPKQSRKKLLQMPLRVII